MNALEARPPVLAPPADERAARRDLRAQIARLQARGACAPAFADGPRLLTLGELEAVRDAMAAREPGGAPTAPFAAARRRWERMLADPAACRGDRVSLAELGRPGCGVYRVTPRLGLVGRLAGWWEVTLSSGCP